ncbi:MAG: serine/threonine protein kinase [Kamptonema sp. SIO1D9]|nr:serine/threonine protein kinase [Kamptonema sp. SIO1D9]
MVWCPKTELQGGKYRIEKILALGGFGITYLAKSDRVGLVAIKTLNDKVQQRPDFAKFQQDFINEALRLAKCTHPHIVKIVELFLEDRLPCLVMEYIEGENLATRIEKHGILTEVEALRYIQQIGTALSVVHDRGLLHRDVKPPNIIVRQDKSEAILIDFGIAREFMPNQTQIHTQLLSDGFAPPEQYEKKATRGAYSDVYSLAATLYYLLTAKLPTPAPDRHDGVTLEPPQKYNPKISDRVNSAILQAMALKPSQRPATITQWLDLLFPPSPTQPSFPAKKTIVSPLFALILLFLGVIGGGSTFWHFFRPLAPNSLNFTTNDTTYAVGDTVFLANTQVCDKNGHGNLQEVVFQLLKDDGILQSTFRITDFLISSQDNSCASFKYELPNLAPGDYQLKAVALDKSQRESKAIIRDFKINAAPKELEFATTKTTYQKDEAVRIEDSQICDENGIDDIEKITFKYRKPGQEWQVDDNEINEFDVSETDTDSNCGSFEYQIDNLPAGDYEFSAIATDKSGFTSETFTRNFKINSPPYNLQFSIDNSFTPPSTITLKNTNLCDDNSSEDLKKISFEIKRDEDEANWRKIGETDNFDKKTKDKLCTFFTYKLNLPENLEPGKYILAGVAYDQSDTKSNKVEKTFTILPREEEENETQPTEETEETEGERE